MVPVERIFSHYSPITIFTEHLLTMFEQKFRPLGAKFAPQTGMHTKYLFWLQTTVEAEFALNEWHYWVKFFVMHVMNFTKIAFIVEMKGAKLSL